MRWRSGETTRTTDSPPTLAVHFTSTAIPNVFVVDLDPHYDERGFFARAFCRTEFDRRGLVLEIDQMNLAWNERAGTTRGLHYQAASHPEAKLFRCIAGETYHVVVDMREGSPSYRGWVGVHLCARSRRALYVPPVCAAGYQALTDGAEILYTASAPYAPEAERGLRQDDPALGIEWPLPRVVVSEKDRSWPLLDE